MRKVQLRYSSPVLYGLTVGPLNKQNKHSKTKLSLPVSGRMAKVGTFKNFSSGPGTAERGRGESTLMNETRGANGMRHVSREPLVSIFPLPVIHSRSVLRARVTGGFLSQYKISLPVSGRVAKVGNIQELTRWPILSATPPASPGSVVFEMLYAAWGVVPGRPEYT